MAYKPENYHERAQQFIKSARSKGMTVKAEGSELIAYPKNYKAPDSSLRRLVKAVKTVGSSPATAIKRVFGGGNDYKPWKR